MEVVNENEPIIVFKLVNIYPDGSLHPLFIDKEREFVIGEVMKCEFHETKGFAPRSITEDELIGGWHCCYQPVAPHLSEELKSGQKRVWIMCIAYGRTQKYDRPESQGGTWLLVEYLIPVKIMTWEEVRKMQEEYYAR